MCWFDLTFDIVNFFFNIIDIVSSPRPSLSLQNFIKGVFYLERLMMSSINTNDAIFLQSFSTAFLAPFQRLWLWVIYILTSIRFFIVILHKKAHRSCKSVDRYFRCFMWISVVWCVLQAWAKINIQYGDWTLWREKIII